MATVHEVIYYMYAESAVRSLLWRGAAQGDLKGDDVLQKRHLLHEVLLCQVTHECAQV